MLSAKCLNSHDLRLYGENPLCARDVISTGQSHRHPNGQSEGLERRLGAAYINGDTADCSDDEYAHVVVVLSSDAVDVERDASSKCKGLEQMRHHLGGH